MASIGCGLAILAAVFMLVGLIPFLGWLNWLTSLPLAIVGCIFFYLDLREPPRSAFSQVGLLCTTVVLCIVSFRLIAGGGLI
jgi:hypothetical protein